MKSTQDPPDGLRRDRPPAVVLGDLNLIRPLAMGGIPVVLVAPRPNDAAIRSRHLTAHYVIPGLNEPHLEQPAARLLELGAAMRLALGRRVPLFYSSDKHLELIYRHRPQIEERFLVLLNEEETALSLHDKERFYLLTERLGIPAPRTLRSGADLERRLGALQEPLLVKPKRKTAWRRIQQDLLAGSGKAMVFATRAELLADPAFARHEDDVIIQEYIPGGVDRLVSFHGFCDRGSRLLASYCGRKIRTYPSFAGDSCFIELVKDEAVAAAGRAIVEKLGLRGPFKIDFIRDERTGNLCTLEINARFNLWNHLGAVNGVNLPLIAYDYLVHDRAPARDAGYEPRCKWLNFYSDYRAFRERHQVGELGLGSWLASIADPSIVHETFAWRDPAPFMQWLGEAIRAKLT